MTPAERAYRYRHKGPVTEKVTTVTTGVTGESDSVTKAVTSAVTASRALRDIDLLPGKNGYTTTGSITNRKGSGGNIVTEKVTQAFELAWVAYGRRGAKQFALQEYARWVGDEHGPRFHAAVLSYVTHRPDPKYRKDFERFIRPSRTGLPPYWMDGNWEAMEADDKPAARRELVI